MANTKIPSELIDGTLGVAGISSSADSTAITIDASERVSIGHTTANADFQVSNAGAEQLEFYAGNASNVNTIQHYNRSSSSYVENRSIANSHTWYNGGTEVARIHTDNNFALGTASPNQDGFDANATVLTIKSANNGEGVLELIGGGNSSGDQISVINFMSQAQANPAAQIKALRNTADDEASITFNTSGAERARITADGYFLVGGTSVASTVLDGTGGSSNGLVIGDTSTRYPALVLQSSDQNWLAQYVTSDGSLQTYNTTTNDTTMKTTTAGVVTFPKTPSFLAYTNASGTTGEIVFTATHHNIGSHYNTSNGRFTAPVAGRYLFTFAILLDPSSNGNYERILFAINGTTSVTYGDTLQDLNYSALSTYHALSASTILSLSANDYVSVFNNGQSGTYGGNYGSFCGQLLS